MTPSVITLCFLGFAVLIPEEYIRMYFENPDKKQVLLFTKQNYAPHKEEIWRLLYKLYLYSLSTASNRIIGMNSCILSIFTLLLTENEEEEESADTMDALSLKSGSQYTDYVNVHYRENIQLKDVASHFGFTTAYFSKLFYRETGRNFKYYLSSIRLSHAVFLLKSTGLSITEIAHYPVSLLLLKVSVKSLCKVASALKFTCNLFYLLLGIAKYNA